MSKLLAYTIQGQIIGIDIQTWTPDTLSGNTAFITIANTGSTPSNYTDITSIINWNSFGEVAGLTYSQVKQEITNLITPSPTPEELVILETWGIFIDTSLISGQTGTFWGDFRVEGKLWVETIRRVKQEANISYVRVDQESGLAGGNIAGLSILNPTGATTGYTSIDVIPYYIIGVDKDGVLVAGWSGDTQPVMRGSATGGTAVWGGITGTLSNQTDLQNVLNAKLNTTTFATYTGTTAPAIYALKTSAITGATNLGAGSGIYGTTSSNRLNLKSLIAGSNVTLNSDTNTVTINAAATAASIIYSATTSNGSTTTTSTTDTLMTGAQITNVGTGTYALNFGTSLSHGSNNASIYTSIYVGGVQVTNSELTWNRPNATITTNHGYSNFIINIASPATVEIRWRTTTGTATSVGNRYLTLLRVK